MDGLGLRNRKSYGYSSANGGLKRLVLRPPVISAAAAAALQIRARSLLVCVCVTLDAVCVCV